VIPFSAIVVFSATSTLGGTPELAMVATEKTNNYAILIPNK
jgi:hypothetical protein